MIERLGGALAFYLPRVFVPLPAAPYVADVPGGAAAWAGLAAGAAVLIAALGTIRLPRWRAVGAGLLFFLATLAPSLVPALRKVSVTPLAERYLYVPSIGAALAVAGLLVGPAGRVAAPRPGGLPARGGGARDGLALPRAALAR